MGKAAWGRKIPINKALGDQHRYKKGIKPSPESASTGGLQKTTFVTNSLPVFILLLVSFAVYYNALSGAFVYDDEYQIVGNPWIRDMRNIPAIFSKSVWSFMPGMATSNYYRPLMHFVYLLNYHLFGLKPWGFHLVNILFHCGASVLVFLIIRRLIPEHGAAGSPAYLSPPFIAAMLFASHPIHTEAVAWIAGLPDVAFTFFFLLSFYLYILWRDGVKSDYLFSILSFSAATLFKEPALTLPVLLIAYDRLVKKSAETVHTNVKRYLPYIVVSGVYLLVRSHALKSFAPIENYPELSNYQLTINVFPLFGEYLAGLLWPFDLSVWRTFHPVSSLLEAKGIISLVVTAIFFIAATAAYRKNRLLLFGLLFVVVPLLPAFYIKAISGKPLAERYLYLPSVGFVFLLAIFLSWAREKLPGTVKNVTMVLIMIWGLYTVGTISRNIVWQNEFNLWSDTVKKSPDSKVAHNHLGRAYAAQGQFDRAIAEYQTALRLDPDYSTARNNLGSAYAAQGQFDRAIAEYHTALRLDPNFDAAHDNLGLAYAAQGQFDRAIAEYQTALRLNPDYEEAYNNLGLVYAAQRQFDRAIAEYQTALRLNPDYEEPYINLGIAYASQGRLDKAVAEFQTALRLKPDYADAHYNLGIAYASQGQLDKAVAEFQTALRLKPDYANAHYNLGIVYASQGQLDGAIAEFQTALRLKPDFQNARQHLDDIASRRR